MNELNIELFSLLIGIIGVILSCLTVVITIILGIKFFKLSKLEESTQDLDSLLKYMILSDEVERKEIENIKKQCKCSTFKALLTLYEKEDKEKYKK